MNIKFKMPKFGRNLTGGGILKELLLTTLATTISIVLTFGTAHVLEQRQANQAQRRTAMMVIHDIDESVARLEQLAEGEEKQKQAVQYVYDHFDQIYSLPQDTLSMALSMITSIYSIDNFFDNSKEKIFNSSQDTWKNLGDVAFVDNMEAFYQSRNDLQIMLLNSPLWKYPITQDECFDIYVNYLNGTQSSRYGIATVLKEKLLDPKIKYYIDRSSYRYRTLNDYVQSWKSLSDRNKFIMNISDEELAEFIKKSQQSGRIVREKDLLGQWERVRTGLDASYYEFLEDDSFNIKVESRYPAAFFSGDIIVSYKCGGKRTFKGDSLIMTYIPASLTVEVDTTGISYRAEMRDSVKAHLDRYFQVSKITENYRRSLKSRKDTLGITINKTNDKIEMTFGRSDDPTKDRVTHVYLSRVK